MLTTIHRLVVPPGSSFDRAGSSSYTAWCHALCFLTDQDGWFQAVWGRQLESPDRLMLLVRWTSEPAAHHFLAHAYARFVDLISPLLAHVPTAPERADLDLNWAWPVVMDGAGPTTVYRHTFGSVPRDERGYDLLGNLKAYVQGLDADPDPAAEGYLGSGWAWTVHPSTGERTATLYIAISWESLAAEACAEKHYMLPDGSNPQAKVLFHDSILSKADAGGECFHVEWVDVSPVVLHRWRESQSHPSVNGREMVT